MSGRQGAMRQSAACRGLMRRWLGGVLLLAAAAAAPAQAETVELPAADAISLLQNIQKAARQVDYAGVFTHQQGSSLQSSRVVHMVDGTGERERLEVLDGTPREFIRHNDTVRCLLPEKKLVLLEERGITRFPGLLLDRGDANPTDSYSVRTGLPPQRVAGRQCQQVDIVPHDTLRYGYRVCIDKDTHLMIRAQTLDARGEVVDQIAFASLQLAGELSPEQLSSRWDTRNWQVVQAATTTADVARQGWRITPPQGFSLAAQVSRPMKSGRPVTQLVLTDSLAAISVFIEAAPESGSQPAVAQASSVGAMSIYGTRVGNYRLTAIGEVPLDTLRTLVESTQYAPPAE